MAFKFLTRQKPTQVYEKVTVLKPTPDELRNTQISDEYLESATIGVETGSRYGYGIKHCTHLPRIIIRGHYRAGDNGKVEKIVLKESQGTKTRGQDMAALRLVRIEVSSVTQKTIANAAEAYAGKFQASQIQEVTYKNVPASVIEHSPLPREKIHPNQ